VKIRPFPILILILALLAAGCASRAEMDVPATFGAVTEAPAEPAELNVFAAASLTAAFGELGALFEARHPEVTVVFNFAGSQQLARQIIEGAPADVFASANKPQMDVVIEARGVAAGTQQTFVQNRLVVIFPQDNPAGLAELRDLSNPGLKLVLAAAEAPVGQYTLDFLANAAENPDFGAAYQEALLGNVVSYEDNVKAVLTKVALGEADAGIVYSSDIAGEDAGKVGRLDIPDALNVIAKYPIAPLTTGKHPELAQAFIEMVLSPEGQDILANYNFIPAVKP